MTKGIRTLEAGARRLARPLRHMPDRLLHGLRRRRTIEQLRSSPPRTVLVMCLGNICRSPFAAAALVQGAAGSVLQVESAGFLESGRPAPGDAQTSAMRRGIDLSAHRSRQVTAELVQSADLIIVMDQRQAQKIEERFQRRRGVLVLGDLDPHPIETRTIRDPYDQAEEIFDQVYARIERCLMTLTRCILV